jgi:ABC-type transport system involved in cytochrome c biogenesis ATPase subunit
MLRGWRIQSEVAISVLPPWMGSPDAPVDISIELGEVPALIGDGPIFVGVMDDESAVVIAEGVGRFHISSGTTVIAQPQPGVYPGAVEMIIIGPVLGALCCQRNIQTLHSNTVAINGQAVALCGPSGAGKSTLAAVLASRGHSLISDDVLMLSRTEHGTSAHTGNRNLRLWRETLELLGHDPATLRRAAVGERDKYYLPATSHDIAPVWTLEALVWLHTAPTETEHIVKLSGLRRIDFAGRALYRRHLAKEYSGRGRHALVDLSLPGVNVYAMHRPRDLSRLDRQADMIEALVTR